MNAHSLHAQLRHAKRTAKNSEARARKRAEQHADQRRRDLASVEPIRKAIQPLLDAGTATITSMIERVVALGKCPPMDDENSEAFFRVFECLAVIGADPAPTTPEQHAILAHVAGHRDISCLMDWPNDPGETYPYGTGQRIYDSILWKIGGAS